MTITCMTRTPRMFRGRLGAMAATVLLGLSACNQLEKVDESGGDGGGTLPTDVQLAFERSCATSAACHAAGGISPTLEGAGITDLIGAPATGSAIPLLTLGDTANSYVALKMLPDDVLAGLGQTRVGSRMPLGFDYASGNADILGDTRTILAWIGGADFPGGDGGEETSDPTTGAASTDSGESETGPGAEPTFADVVSKVITPTCFCHNAAPNDAANGGLSMMAGMEYASIVGVKSNQLATMNLVTASDPDNSYLYLKVINKHLDAGGSGDVMPLGAMLSADKALIIEEWIAAGALDN